MLCGYFIYDLINLILIGFCNSGVRCEPWILFYLLKKFIIFKYTAPASKRESYDKSEGVHFRSVDVTNLNKYGVYWLFLVCHFQQRVNVVRYQDQIENHS